MKIIQFFNTDFSDLNWEFIDSLRCFSRLKDTQQSTLWHKEGNVWEHTKLTVKEMKKVMEEVYDIDKGSDEWKILMMAALCHDLGKAETTTFDEKKKDYVTKNHGAAGERITRSLLHDESIGIREIICYMVRHHMTLHHIFDSDGVDPKKLIKLSCGLATVRQMVILNHADSLASINDVKTLDDINKDINQIIVKSIELKCYDKVYEKVSSHELIARFNNSHTITLDRENPFDVYIMCGYPGSGKTTYAQKNHPDCPILSRDIIRYELGMTDENGKTVGSKTEEKEVTKIFNRRLYELCEKHQSFVIDNINLKRAYRKEIINFLLAYDTTIIIEYVEAPTLEDCVKRREGQIDRKVFAKMKQYFDFPQLYECDILRFIKQTDKGEDVYGTLLGNLSLPFDTMVGVDEVVNDLKNARDEMKLKGCYSFEGCQLLYKCTEVMDKLIKKYESI